MTFGNGNKHTRNNVVRLQELLLASSPLKNLEGKLGKKKKLLLGDIRGDAIERQQVELRQVLIKFGAVLKEPMELPPKMDQEHSI